MTDETNLEAILTDQPQIDTGNSPHGYQEVFEIDRVPQGTEGPVKLFETRPRAP